LPQFGRNDKLETKLFTNYISHYTGWSKNGTKFTAPTVPAKILKKYLISYKFRYCHLIVM